MITNYMEITHKIMYNIYFGKLKGVINIQNDRKIKPNRTKLRHKSIQKVSIASVVLSN